MTLLVKEFETVKRWQSKGLRIYQQKLDKFNSWKTSEHPGEPAKWLTDNPVFIAVKAWIEMLSNMASLIIAISSLGLYTKLRRLQERRQE